MQKMKNTKGGFTLIEILVVIGIIAILATIVLIAINPARQFRQAHDTQRVSNVNAILNAIGQYIADNKGAFPEGVGAVAIGTSALEIKKAAGGIDLCSAIAPKYLPSLPVDPTTGTNGTAVGAQVTDCSTAYATGYSVKKDTNGRVTVSAVGEEPAGADISVTR